jgi:hypothetical protein
MAACSGPLVAEGQLLKQRDRAAPLPQRGRVRAGGQAGRLGPDQLVEVAVPAGGQRGHGGLVVERLAGKRLAPSASRLRRRMP